MTDKGAKTGFTLKDRRKAYRTSVKLESENGNSQKRYYRSIDISVSGISLATEFPLPVGEQLVLDFKMPQVLEPIRIRAEVVRVLTSDGRPLKNPASQKVIGFGVKFLELQPVQKQVIREYISSDGDDLPEPR